MTDRVNDELLSAYLDNEVSDEERAKVERALVDSSATRVSLESLKQVQSRLQAIPRLTLSNDFHERVVREAERRSQDQRVTPVSVRSAQMAKWIRISAVAATVAAVLVVALVIVFDGSDPEVVEIPVPDGPVLAQDDTPLPGDDAIAVRPPQEMILVVDLAITKQGQIDDAFTKILRQAGITYDERLDGVQLGEELQHDLLSTRLVAGVNQPVQNPVIEHFDVVDMIYVSANGAQVSEIHKNLVMHPEIRAILDAAMRPSKVLNSVGQKTWSYAKSKSKTGSPRSYAYRLNIGVTLHSSRGSFLAKFPTPGIQATLVPIEEKRDGSGGNVTKLDLDRNQPTQLRQKKATVDTTVPEELQVFELLVIRRHLEGGFP
jgi:hypothetical protein